MQLDADDRRQHLGFIQAVITRMSQASAACKTWLLPVVVGSYGYAISRDAAAVGALGLFAVIVFCTLDANYLKQERAFRKLYDDVANGVTIPSFSMNAAMAAPSARVSSDYWPGRREYASWAIAPVYGPLGFAGLGITVWLLMT